MNKSIVFWILLMGVMVQSAVIDPDDRPDTSDHPENPDADWGDFNEPEEDDEVIELETRGGPGSRMCGNQMCGSGQMCAKRCRSRCVEDKGKSECPGAAINFNKGDGESCSDSCNCAPEYYCKHGKCRLFPGGKPATPIDSATIAPNVPSEQDMEDKTGKFGGGVSGAVQGVFTVDKTKSK